MNPNEGVCMRMSPFHWININCFISSYSNKLTNEKMCRNGGEEDAWQGAKENIIKYQRQKREMAGFEKCWGGNILSIDF